MSEEFKKIVTYSKNEKLSKMEKFLDEMESDEIIELRAEICQHIEINENVEKIVAYMSMGVAIMSKEMLSAAVIFILMGVVVSIVTIKNPVYKKAQSLLESYMEGRFVEKRDEKKRQVYTIIIKERGKRKK